MISCAGGRRAHFFLRKKGARVIGQAGGRRLDYLIAGKRRQTGQLGRKDANG